MRKKIIIIISIVLVIVIGFISTYFIIDNKNINKIKNIKSNNTKLIILKDFEVEYGDKITSKDIIDKYVKDKKKVTIYIDNKVLKNDYTFNDIKNHKIKIEINDNYKYNLLGSHKKSIISNKNAIIKVVDTNMPVIEGIKDKTIYVGDIINLKDGIKAYDKVDGDLEIIIDGDVDSNKAGTYEIKVKTKDKNNNEIQEKFNVYVKEKPKPVVTTTSNENIKSGTTSKGYKIEYKSGAHYINGILVANKSYALASTYAPGGLLNIFTDSFNKMASDARSQGINLNVISGYRSYSRQKEIYSNYVNRDGREKADTYSARPGNSEHQTGLAADVNSLYQSFGNTNEGIWLSNNCYKYGFIIRYPKGKESITGYIYEPWHIRYVGTDVASKLYNNGNWITLEEYLGIDSKY